MRHLNQKPQSPSDIEIVAVDGPARARSNSLVVEQLDPKSIVFSRRPLRKGYEERVQKHVVSQDTYGHILPVIIGPDGEALIGEERVEAAIRREDHSIPVIRVTRLSEDKIRAFRLMETKIASTGELDPANIRLEFEAILELEPDFDFSVTGFEIAEQDIILSFGETGTADELDAADTDILESAEPLVTQPGDTWCLKDHRLVCGDARKPKTLKRLMLGETARAVITDPPYNVPMKGHASGMGQTKHREFVMASGELSRKKFRKLLKSSLANASGVCVDGALLYVCMDWRGIELLLSVARKLGLTLVNICVWAKTNSGMGSFYRSQHEFVCVFRTGNTTHMNNVQLGKFGRNRSNLWTYAGVNTFARDRMAQLTLHPTVKPIALVADAIRDCSKRGDIILDGFAGSGTALIAAEKTGRRAFCAELDPAYVDVAVRRFQDRFDVEAVHEGTGLTFDEVAAQRRDAPEEHPKPASPITGRIRTRSKSNASPKS